MQVRADSAGQDRQGRIGRAVVGQGGRCGSGQAGQVVGQRGGGAGQGRVCWPGGRWPIKGC